MEKVDFSFSHSNTLFETCTDACDMQLGAVISQKGQPVAFFSQKLTDKQQHCTTTELELLSVVEILKDHQNVLMGHCIIVCADHENLTHKANRVLFPRSRTNPRKEQVHRHHDESIGQSCRRNV